MQKCWAAKLGNCCGTISKEHLISSCLYDQEAITVKGLSWCKDNECTIGLDSLTSKILCKQHNNDLSEVDIGGAAAFNTLKKMKHQLSIREKMSPRRWTKTKYHINGLMLERWFLKTGINLIYYNPTQLKDENQSPDKDLLEVIYGLRNMDKYAGLYITFSEGQTFPSDNTIEFNLLSDSNHAVTGFRFTFQGFRFWLSLSTTKHNGIKSHNSKEKSDNWSNSQLIYHPETVNIKQGKHISQIINFKW